MRVLKSSLAVLKAYKLNGLYVLKGETMIGPITIANESGDKTLTWHKRLKHLSDQRQLELSKRSLISDEKITSVNLCGHCILEKR